MNELLILLLPVAAFSGWWWARADNKSYKNQKADDYFKGLSYLLEDETDKAIDIFFRIAHLDDSTIENQITVGNLFRHRGEIDRALHIHSSLSQKHELSPETALRLDLALADDYRAAGIMNHAVDYYRKVSEASHADMRHTARRKLIKLYDGQGRWQDAIDIVDVMDPFKRDSVQQQAAHYHCELADLSLACEPPDTGAVTAQLKMALARDSQCVRATIALGQLAKEGGDTIAAIGFFHQVEKQNAAFLPEIVDAMEACYIKLDQHHEWKKDLQRIVATYHNPVLTLRLNALIAKTEGSDAALEFLAARLRDKPNMMTLQAYLNLVSYDDHDAAMQLVQDSVSSILGYALKYRCRECGFRGNTLDWHCPGCKNWGTFTPVSDLSLKENISQG